jgi:hypothetical protein
MKPPLVFSNPLEKFLNASNHILSWQVEDTIPRRKLQVGEIGKLKKGTVFHFYIRNIHKGCKVRVTEYDHNPPKSSRSGVFLPYTVEVLEGAGRGHILRVPSSALEQWVPGEDPAEQTELFTQSAKPVRKALSWEVDPREGVIQFTYQPKEQELQRLRDPQDLEAVHNKIFQDILAYFGLMQGSIATPSFRIMRVVHNYNSPEVTAFDVVFVGDTVAIRDFIAVAYGEEIKPFLWSQASLKRLSWEVKENPGMRYVGMSVELKHIEEMDAAEAGGQAELEELFDRRNGVATILTVAQCNDRTGSFANCSFNIGFPDGKVFRNISSYYLELLYFD